MADTPILGKELAILYNAEVVARATDYDFELNGETIDISSLDSNGWQELMKGDLSWKITFSGLVTKGAPATGYADYNALLEDLKTSQDAVTVGLKHGTPATFNYQTGSAFLTSLKLSGKYGDKVTYQGTLTGTGKLTTISA
jgi:predicted secreted protein